MFKTFISMLAVCLAFSASANTLTYQEVTFNTWDVDQNTLGLSILNATNASGNWQDVQYLSAFEIKDIGDVTSATIVSGPGYFGDTVNNGLSANLGCVSGGTPGACFFALPALTLEDSMTWIINFGGLGLHFDAPHLKVQFINELTDSKAVGSLLSQTIPGTVGPVSLVPEPSSGIMLLSGLGLLGFLRMRQKK